MKIRFVILAAALGLVGAACSVEPTSDTVKVDSSTPPAAAPSLPVVSDFSASLVTTSSDCYGSAGGLVTVEPEFEYTGPAVDSDGFQLIYQINGGEDHPVVDNIRVDSDGNFNVDTKVIGTATCGDELTIAVTDIR